MITVHPVVKIVSFLILSLFLAGGNPLHLAVTAGLLFLFYLYSGPAPLGRGWAMLRRMRWFFLSILIIYFWFTPGDKAWPAAPEWLLPLMPSGSGMAEGGVRVGALVLMVLMVNALLWLTPRTQLIAALYRLTWPLALVQGARERLALRLALVLEYVGQAQQLYEEVGGNGGKGPPLRRISGVAGTLFLKALARAEAEPQKELEIPLDDPTPLYQWLLPLGLGLGLWWLGGFYGL